ncbi:MAG: glycerophosphodiester phosphodiesterase [Dysgonamonadaceae bacterium]|jgi:glycerophosphoryl diester phosphodiesterase|nr:glycerophosphodiester phosphodiesterase [Dysgonamonadaceae bacterium]
MKKLFLYAVEFFVIINLIACSVEKDDGPEFFFPDMRTGIMSHTKIIAHKGYWDTKGSTENSLAALDKAAEAGFYGSEFDVRFTSDRVPVIHHDAKIQGLTIETTPYSQIKNFKLKNGETLPTLWQYLDRGKGKNIQLILEFKSFDLEAIAFVVTMVKEMEMEKQVEYLSFDPPVCREIIRLSPSSPVTLLLTGSGKYPPAKLKEWGFTGIDCEQGFLRQNPQWISDVRAEGLTINVWTVNDPAQMMEFLLQEVDFITTDKPLLLQQITGSK